MKWLFSVLLLVAGVTNAKTAVVATGQCESDSGARHVGALISALRSRSGNEVIGQAELIERLGGAPRASLAALQRQLSGARTDVLVGDDERAPRSLEATAAELKLLPPSAERWAAIADAYMLFAQMKLRDGDDEAAARTARQVLLVDPKFVPSVDLYPPSFRKWVDGLRTGAEAERTATLHVTSRPSGVPVYVDGSPVGTAPVTLAVVPAEHRVEGGFSGGRGIVRTIRVETRGSVEIDQEFDGSIVRTGGPCIDPPGGREGRLVALVQLGALLGAERVAAVREEDASPGERYLVASMVDARTGEEVREARIKLYGGGYATGSMERLADFLATGEAEPPVLPLRGAVDIAKKADTPAVVHLEPASVLPVQPPAVVRPKREPPSRVGPVIAFGAGAASLVGAGVFAALAQQSSGELDALHAGGAFPAGSEPQVQALNSRFATQQTAALTLTGAATAALITGAVLWLTTSPEEEVAR